jgi:DNA repair exonuclease SbcCD ATPase subunit
MATDILSPAAIEAIRSEAREKLAKITPGEWEAENMETREDGSEGNAWGVASDTGRIVVLYDFIGESDAKFVAAAPRLLRDLLAAFDQVEQEREELRSDFDSFVEHHRATEASLASLQQELDAEKANLIRANEDFEAARAELEADRSHLVAALRELEQEMREVLEATKPQPVGGQHVGPRLYQHPTTHRFAKDYLKPWADRLSSLTQQEKA